MQLVYRGTPYFSFPHHELAIARCQSNQTSQIPHAIIPLKYRGTAYLKLT